MQKNKRGTLCLPLAFIKMIDKVVIENLVTECLADTDCFLVDVKISPSNQIVVEIDSDTIVDIDLCVKISRHIDENMDREVEDFELEVGSCGNTLNEAKNAGMLIAEKLSELIKNGFNASIIGIDHDS